MLAGQRIVFRLFRAKKALLPALLVKTPRSALALIQYPLPGFCEFDSYTYLMNGIREVIRLVFRFSTRRLKGSFTMRLHLKSVVALFTLMFVTNPMAKAVDLLYASLWNNTIVTYDTSGNNGTVIASTVSTFASTNLSDPYGLAFDSSGNLYAANYGDSTISKFNAQGNYVSKITSNLSGPLSLAFDSTGNLYAANFDNNTISKFNSGGGYLGNINTNLNYPSGLVFDSSGTLLAANSANNTISKFNSSGVYQSNISSNLNKPYGMVFDGSGNLYVANFGNSTISKYNSSGVYQSNITSNLNGPLSLVFDSSGNLYAANGNKTISKYDSSGNFLTSWSTGTTGPHSLVIRSVAVPEPSTYALAATATGGLYSGQGRAGGSHGRLHPYHHASK